MDLAKHQRRPRLELKLRHHPDNLHALYRESEDPVERSRWHAIWLLATGHSIRSCKDFDTVLPVKPPLGGTGLRSTPLASPSSA
jgi:hypothetical protein